MTVGNIQARRVTMVWVHFAVARTRDLIRSVVKDERGAALIEYTVLLGILIVAVIATIGLVGTWVNGEWTALEAALPS
jgi:pilus assembly protein Flp/PilA